MAAATVKPAYNSSGAALAAGAPTVPLVVFCTSVRRARSGERTRAGESTASPGAGGPSLTVM